MTVSWSTTDTGARVLLIAGDVAWNLGDRAIRAAIVDQVRRACPGAAIITYTKSPARDRAEFGIDEPVSSMRELLQRARYGEFDAVLWGGGHLLQDDSSKLKCVYWALVLTALRRLAQCPIVGYGIGVGPVDSGWGKFFSRQALRQIERMIVRDERSAHCVRRLVGDQFPLSAAPDPAVDLRPAALDDARRYLGEVEGVTPAEGELVIGVAPRRWFHIRNNILPHKWRRKLGAREAGAETYEQFKANLAAALNRTAAGRRARFLLFPFYSAPWEGDDRECADLARRLDAPAHVLRLVCAPPVVKALTGLCGLFVSVRLHAGILALGMGVPTVSIAYASKAPELFRALGEEDRLVDIGDAAGDDGEKILEDILRDTLEERDAIAGELRRKWSRFAEGCRSYDHLLERVVGGEGRAE